MNIALSHLTLNFLGGEENLCLSFIDALKRGGHRVTLFTVEKTDWDLVRQFFGSITLPDEEICATSSIMHDKFLKTSTLMLAYANFLAGLIRLNRNKRYGLIINSYGDLINSVADLTYVHFPLRATLDYSQTPAFISPLRWQVYCRVYTLAASVLDKVKPGILLTNSKFTKQVAQKYLKRDMVILHPPVDVHAFASGETERKDYVITVSKFTPKRALYRVPLIARSTRNVKFLIVGAADTYSSDTISGLEKMIRDCGVYDRVTLLPNVSRPKLIQLLTQAKVYLHVMPDEHFGISIIEAMAGGCIPIVHRSGGPWVDTLEQQQGKNGFSYATVEEAAELIDLLVDDQKLCRKMASAAQERAWDYDKSSFDEKLISIVNSLSFSDWMVRKE
jgi:glycosyltransferase involved in cell wall biosynthesis